MHSPTQHLPTIRAARKIDDNDGQFETAGVAAVAIKWKIDCRNMLAQPIRSAALIHLSHGPRLAVSGPLARRCGMSISSSRPFGSTVESLSGVPSPLSRSMTRWLKRRSMGSKVAAFAGYLHNASPLLEHARVKVADGPRARHPCRRRVNGRSVTVLLNTARTQDPLNWRRAPERGC